VLVTVAFWRKGDDPARVGLRARSSRALPLGTEADAAATLPGVKVVKRYVLDTDLSMADVIYDSGVVTARATVSGSATTATSIWVNHGRIAVRQEAEAHEARERLRAQYAAGEPFEANEEFEASLLAITNAALAIDGFYGCVEKTSPIDPHLRRAWGEKGLARHRWIVDPEAPLPHWRRDKPLALEVGVAIRPA
jgi:hypothetical protein